MLEFQEGPFTRPLAIIYKRGRELSPAVRKFIEVLTTSKLTPHAQGHSEKATRDRDRTERERGDHRERESGASARKRPPDAIHHR